MKIELVPIDSLTPYDRNARTHSDEQVAQIAASIKKFGFINPILANADGLIVGGHGRLLAARLLGLREVPVVRDSPIEQLSDAERRAYTIADNRLALDAAWDWAMLGEEVHELTHQGIDLQLLGFDDREMSLLERLGDDSDPVAAGTQTIGEGRFLLQLEFDTERELQTEFEAAQSRGLRVKVLT